MTEGRSVWDTGPQYRDIWPGESHGKVDSLDPDVFPEDDETPPTPSPVDIDVPPATATPDPRPVVKPVKKSAPAWWQRPLLGFPVWMWIGFLAVVGVVFALVATSGGPDSKAADVSASPTVRAAPVPLPTAPVVVVQATAVPATTPVTTTAVPAVVAPLVSTAPVTAAPITPAPQVSVAPSVPVATLASPSTPVPTQPARVVPSPSATLPASGPVVTIIGKVAPCKFGRECLVTGFTIHDFDTQPAEFVCEFGDGSRYAFHFNSAGVDEACATGDPTSSITIEIDGVRSATYRHP